MTSQNNYSAEEDDEDLSDEEDEEEEEEEDEDEEESQDAQPPSKRKKTASTRSKFIDDSADVDAEADEEDDDEEAGVKELEKELAQRRSAEETEREREKRRNALIMDPNMEAEEMRRLASDVARRYGGADYDDEEDEDEEAEDELDEDDSEVERRPAPIHRRRVGTSEPANLLPSIRDPKLWLLRCKPGTEQQVICDLMRRSYVRATLPQDALFIKTAFMTNVGSGYFYVEAEKEVHVRKAIANIRFVNTRKVTLVPIKEMVQAITIQKKKISVKRGDWVRMKRGIYKGDLAQVLATADQGTQITMKVIPRVDYTKLGNEEKPAHFTPKTRPAARLLNPAELRELGEYLERRQEPITRQNCLFFNNNFYKNGFLYKTMKISNVIVDGVGATLGEVEKFQQRIAESDDEDDRDEDLIQACRTVAAMAQEHGPKFAKGNSVKVIRGDLKHLTGVVLSIVDDKITMMPAHEDLHEPITFPQSDLRKYFKLGDHVKVLSKAVLHFHPSPKCR